MDGSIFDEFLDQEIDDNTIAAHIFELTINGSDEEDFQADVVRTGGKYWDVSSFLTLLFRSFMSIFASLLFRFSLRFVFYICSPFS